MSVLRLLTVTHFPPLSGGSARSCWLLFRKIAERGHHVLVSASITPAYRNFDREIGRAYPANLSVERYPVPYYSIDQAKIEGFLPYQANEHEVIRDRLPEMIRRFRPDVVVAAHETLGEAVVDIAHAHGLPCALMLRGSPTWQIVTDAYPQEHAVRYMKLYASADVVVPVGRYMQSGLEARGIKRLRHIPNLLDLSLFSPGPRNDLLRDIYDIPHDSIVLLHASSMQGRKRPLDIIDSGAIALPQQDDLVYVFLGGGEKTEEIRAAAQERGLEGRMRFIDSVDYERMPDHIRMADMVVLASQGEGVARISIETQACGRVIISSNIPAGHEVIDHGQTGLLFRTGDPADLAKKVLLAARNPLLRAAMGEAACRRVRVHDIDNVVDQYLNVFSSVCGK